MPKAAGKSKWPFCTPTITRTLGDGCAATACYHTNLWPTRLHLLDVASNDQLVSKRYFGSN